MKMILRNLGCIMLLCLCLLPAAALASEEPAVPEAAEALPAYGYETVIQIGSDPGNDNDALFAAYVDAQLYGETRDGPALDGGSTGERLTGQNAVLYRLLKDFMGQAAAGEVNEAHCTIRETELGLKTEWTAEELHLSSISSDNVHDALSAYSETISFDGSQIMNCLLADLPYDLYWYDKTTGWTVEIYNSILYYPTRATFTTTIDFYFAVSQEYRAANSLAHSVSGDSKTILYSINTTIPQRVKDAAANAASIVKKNEGKGDYAKLDAYRTAICEYTSYNTPASNSASYGDPWQLIFVFDGDKSTTVVCEGYAKAFQYLFDLSEFESPKLSCVLVSGNLTDADSRNKNHMWNIVTMDDGNRYLVDITNCDAGTVGYPNQLFLKGWSSHSGNAYTFRCSAGTAGYTYGNEALSMFTAEELSLCRTDYTVHTHSYTKQGETTASCMEPGVVTYVCSCGSSYTKETSPTGHIWGEWNASPITGIGTVGEKTRRCGVCGETETEEISADLDGNNVLDHNDFSLLLERAGGGDAAGEDVLLFTQLFIEHLTAKDAAALLHGGYAFSGLITVRRLVGLDP